MSIKKKYELTQVGLENLKSELQDLKDVKRPENLAALKEAREQGDLSENADYDAARNEQARIESRIQEIEAILKNYTIIKIDDNSTITIGKKVTIRFIEKNEDKEFQLVGSIEADPIKGRVSIESPLGKSLKGHEKNDVITVKSETGKHFQVKILEVK